MTLQEAIKILKVMRNINLNYCAPDRKNALSLGINALIFYKKLKAINAGEISGNFLGETEEKKGGEK